MNASVKSAELACPFHGAPRALLALRHVLAIVDPAASEHACLEKAARIAAHTGAALELHVCDQDPDRQTRNLRLLESLVRPLRARGLSVRTASEWAAPVELGVGFHVIRTMPDLVVAARSAELLADQILMRQLPVPLLLVRQDPWPERVHITACVDPCKPAVRTPALDEEVLTASLMLADALRAELSVLHVLETPPHLPGESVSRQQRSARHAAARAVVQSLIAGANASGLPVRISFEEGRVAESIIEYAHVNRPQVLTLGAAPRPRWAFGGTGGTAAQILDAIPCDMLVVKPPGFVSPLLVTDE